MFVLNFVTVSASNCNNALKATKEILTYYTKYKFFEVGAFTLCYPDDFIKINQGEIFKFENIVGTVPSLYKQRILERLNCDVKPMPTLLKELSKTINSYTKSKESNCLYNIDKINTALRGNYIIDDLTRQTKYPHEWKHEGLTHLQLFDPTHMVLIEFHI